MNHSGNVGLYLATILGVLTVTVGGLVILEIWQIPIDRGFLGIISAVIVPTLTVLLTGLKAEANSQANAKKIDDNTKLTQQIADQTDPENK